MCMCMAALAHCSALYSSIGDINSALYVWLASETTSDRECLFGGCSLDTPVARISKSQIDQLSRRREL